MVDSHLAKCHPNPRMISGLLSLYLSAVVDFSNAHIFTNRSLKMRQERSDVSTVRMNTLAKAMPYYNQLAMSSWNFGWSVIEQPSEDYKISMYYFCNMLYFRELITRKFGDVQLDNLNAEKILCNFWRDVKELIVKKFGNVDTSRLTYLVSIELPYHEFESKIFNGNNQLRSIRKLDIDDE